MSQTLESILSSYDREAPLSRASTLSAAWYTDPRIYDLERSSVFGRSWQCVARSEQVSAPGQYVTGHLAGEPIVVIRGGDGVLRAFFNVCRHHAAEVVSGCEGVATKLRCPYHGWTYGADGSLLGAPEFEGVEGFEKGENGLVGLRVEAWESFVFVCMDAAAPSLSEYIGRMGSEVAGLGVGGLGVGALRFVERRSYELRCNWKVFIDNYLDGGYHVPHIHKALGSVLDYSRYTIDTRERHCLQLSPVTSGGGGDSETASVRGGDRAYYYWLYPNFMLNWYEGVMDVNIALPLGVDRTLVLFDFYFAESASRADRDRNALSIRVAERIQQEDIDVCESVQRGLGSRAYGAGRLSVRREAGEQLFHRLLSADVSGASSK